MFNLVDWFFFFIFHNHYNFSTLYVILINIYNLGGSTMKSQQNANISGFGNVIIQNQYEIQEKQQLSEKYSASD